MKSCALITSAGHFVSDYLCVLPTLDSSRFSVWTVSDHREIISARMTKNQQFNLNENVQLYVHICYEL